MKTQNKTTSILRSWYDFKLTIFFEGILVGIIAGLITVLFRILIEKSEALTHRIYQYLLEGHIFAILGWFSLLIAAAIFVGYLVTKTPMISGSGIPQVKGYLLRQLDMEWIKVLPGKFLGGIFSIGAGLSLGREGPSIQLGASAGKGVGKLLKRPDIEEKYLVLGGAGAGLAAAFNAPLAGVMFVMEELQKGLSPAALACAMGACVAADFVSKQIVGLSPAFQFTNINALPLKNYPILIVLGVICGVMGKVFNSSILKFQDLYAKIPKKLAIFKPIIPFVMAGVLGIFFSEVTGGGHSLIVDISARNVDIGLILLLIALKLLFTSICYGSAVPGGIFLPLLVIGALLGKGIGTLATGFLGIDATYQLNFIILGMTAYFAGVVKAPVTGSILITEMTGSFSHLLALLTVSMTAYVITDVIHSFSIYERLLEKMLKNQRSDRVPTDESNEKIIMEIPVGTDSYLENRLISDVDWPKSSLIVGIQRGEHEIIPNGNTRILQGDIIAVLANKNQGKDLKMKLVKMGQTNS